MFTGLIEEQGRVEALEQRKNLCTLKISASQILPGTKIGDSIAIDGVCLTVTKIQKPSRLTFEMMKETMERTTLKDLKPNSRVNLERALKAGDRLGGHFVTGHVDGGGTIQKILESENYAEFQISLNKNLRKFLVPKCSVTVDGVSLTVGKVAPQFFSIYLIPHTRQTTTLGFKKEGNRVNIETDVLAKYVLSKKF